MNIRSFISEQAVHGHAVKRPIAVLLFTLAATLALWFAIRADNRAHTLADIAKSLGTINAYKSEQITSWLRIHKREAERLSRHPFLFEIVSQELARPGARRDQLKTWLKDHTTQRHYYSMALLSPKGAVIAATPGYAAGTEPVFKAAFLLAAQKGKPQLTDLYLNAAGLPRMTMFSPVSAGGRGGRPVCVLVAKIAPETELYPLVKASPLLFSAAETLLVRKDGDSVLFLNDLDYAQDAALKFKRPLAEENLPAAAALKNISGFFTGTDYRGQKVFSFIGHIASPAWAVVTKVDQAAVLGPARTKEYLALALMLVTALLIYGAFYAILLARERSARERIEKAETALGITEQIFREFMEHSPIYVFFKDENIRSLRLSRNFEKMIGRPLGELLGKSMDEIFPSDFAKKMVADDLKILREGKEVNIEETFNGRHYITTKFPINLQGRPSYLAGFTIDVTEQKRSQNINMARLRLLNFAATHTLEELLQETLDEAEKLSGSAVGFYHFLEADQKTLSLQNWSTRTKAEFCKAEGKGRHYPVSQAGVWTDCVRERKPVIHNDYASLPHRKGLPPGHAPVTRELVVPVFRGDRIMAILGVGNKASDYDQADVEMISIFANLAWDIAERKLAQEQAARMTERVLLAARAAHLGVWDWDLESKALSWDDNMFAIYGVKREDFPGAYEAWLNGVHPDDRARCDEDSRRALGGERAYDTEFRIVRPGGEVRWLKASADIFRDAGGKPKRMVGVNFDITEIRRAEEAILRSEQDLKEAQRLAHIGNWTLDLVSGRLAWSDEIYRIFELDPGKFGASYDTFLNAIHPDDRELVNKAYTDSVRNKSPYSVTHRLLMPDGRVKYVNECCETIYDNEGKALRSAGTVQDITGQTLVQEDLRETEERLRALINSMPDIVCFKDGKGRWLEANNFDLKLFQLENVSYKGKKDSELAPFSPFYHDAFMACEDSDEKAWRASGFSRGEERIPRPDGGEYVFDIIKVPLFTPEGKRKGLTVVGRDITERKRAELQAEKLNRELAEKNKEMENFLYITTHDLRSPLVNIQGFSQNLERYLKELKQAIDGLSLPPSAGENVNQLTAKKIPEALDFVLSSSRKMDALITALLKVSRAGRVEMKPENTDMTAMIRKILDAMRFQLEEAGADVKLGALPPCKADQGAVSQIFTNLLDNAVKYRDESRAPEIEVSGETRGEMVSYKVADNGPGIPEKDLSRIWNVFYSHGRGAEHRGEGIGLPMVRRMVEKNGGNIRVESKEGAGTVFYVELPAAGRDK